MSRCFMIGLLGFLVISACGNKGSYGSAKEGGLNLMAIRTKQDGLLKIRVALEKYDEGFDVRQFATNMQYHVDSCFYLSDGGKRTYPLYITPIANGIDKTFEYLVGFEKEILNTDTLVFVDRHRSKRNITLTFK